MPKIKPVGMKTVDVLEKVTTSPTTLEPELDKPIVEEAPPLKPDEPPALM